MEKLEFVYPLHHEIVGLWKDLPDKVFEKFKNDIAEHGQIDPITVWIVDPRDCDTWVVIDGRHRQRACVELGLQPIYDERTFESQEAAESFANSKNHMRRKDLNKRTNAEKVAAIKIAFDTDPDRSDRDIAEEAMVSNHMVAKWRKKLGFESDQRVAADGRVFSQDEATGENENSPIATETPDSAPITTNQDENDLGDDANCLNIDEIVEGLCAGKGRTIKSSTKTWLRLIMESEPGNEICKRYNGWTIGKRLPYLRENGLVDLRLGWPNLGSTFAENMAVKSTHHKKISDILTRAEDLDKINEENEGKSDYQQGQHSARYWSDMSKLNPPAEPIASDNVTSFQEHKDRPKFSFHGENIPWHDVEGMTYEKARCVAKLVQLWYDEYFPLINKANKVIEDHDVSNFARTIRFMGDSVEGFADRDSREIVVMIASALERNKSKRQRRHEVDSALHNTNQ